MIMYELLDKTKAPWIFNSDISSSIFLQKIIDIYGEKIEKSLFILNANNMKTWEDLFIEFAKVMQFPDYFGYNRDALDECLGDLYEWLDVDEYILFIKNSENLLKNDMKKNKNLQSFINQLSENAQELSMPIQYEEEDNVNNRKAYPFHVILSINSE